MNARLLAALDALRSSYWFLPSLMALGATALAVLTTTLDGMLGADWLDGVPWLQPSQADGARSVLSTIAGSMIGVAGVTFSITIASVVYASGQYGPRLLSNFMRDRGNQITLGTFIATFIYCLLVLQTVRAQGEDTQDLSAFVPHIALLTGVVLALLSITVLIYFIHHIPESILVSNVIAGIGRELLAKMDAAEADRSYGQDETTDQNEAVTLTARYGMTADISPEQVPDEFFDDAARVKATGTGYIESIDTDAMVATAIEHDLLIRLRYRPGDFVTEGDALMLVWPPDTDEAVCGGLNEMFAWGKSRTPLQDTRFLVNELVEIAARALSPGVNDPFTAMSCMDWLGAALKRMRGQDFPSETRFDDEGELRLVATSSTYADLVDSSFGQLRPYAASDRNAALHALKILGEVGGATDGETACSALRREVDALLVSAGESLGPADLKAVEKRHRTVASVFGGRPYEAIAAEVKWLGGSA
ncbi:MAG: DUF2254 domain-containing protein [Bacteroidota bacterium]